MQTRNLLIFFAVTLLLFVGYYQVKQRFFPPPPEQPTDAEQARKKDRAKKDEQARQKEKAKEEAKGKEGAKPPVGEFRLPPEPEATPDKDLVRLGERDANSTFHLGVALDPLGGGVRSVVLNKFQSADWRGKPEWEDPKAKVARPLELVADEANRRAPSFLFFHFDVNDPTGERPLDTLGRRRWEVVRNLNEQTEDGRVRQVVAFRTEVPGTGVVVTKTYSLAEGEYHLGLKVTLERKKGKAKPVQFRYQLTGAHGLPVEGKWYTTTFRNALIAEVALGGSGVDRHIQELRQISHWEGGNQVDRQEGKLIRYAGVAVQYFASVIVVDEGQKNQAFLRRARPTLETAVAKGTVKSVSRRLSKPWFVLTDEKNVESDFYAPPAVRERLDDLREGQHVAVIYHTGDYDERLKGCPRVVDEVRRGDPADATHALWVDDVTVRVATEPAELAPGESVTHDYLLYHGPVKPSLLGQFSGDKAVAPGLVDRYAYRLHLNTLTDYHSPGWMGSFANAIYWTELLIWFTNKMHLVLGWLHAVIPNYGLCIILLTVLVRGLMFPISRKQALTSLRMQELAPELKKLGEKYKDDRQALGMAQMDLYRKHGVNPFGTCWLLLLQMPIFMGLYYALQESIHFRLAWFWPTWIDNLAAPDMLFYWGESIPFLSQREYYGGFQYLGPYFNLLPVIAVALMIVQQRMMTPPPADEQQAMQQKMMTGMMVLFGLFFYKVAAGLCVYFIASSLWGFAERRLLPKKKKAGAGPEPPPPPAGQPSTGITGPLRNRPGRKRKGERPREDEEPTGAIGRLLKRVRDWWENVLEQAQKK